MKTVSMTKFEYFMNKSNQCMDMARYSRVNENKSMSDIWLKHAISLKNKANNLTLEQAQEIMQVEKYE